MIYFDDGEEKLNKFLGSEKKTTVLYKNELYMLKYPDPIRGKKLKDLLSYKNNQYSEHIGSSIFRACGVAAQETALGYFTDANGKEKIVVGCKDFTQDGGTLYEFSKLANQTTASEEKFGATIENIYFIVNNSRLLKDKTSIINGFWDMFVIDTLIGNSDRHFGNWGVLEKNGEVKLAPVYDCGSSLGALFDDDEMIIQMKTAVSFKAKEYNLTSCYHMGGKKIFYHEIFRNPPNDLAKAIQRIVPKIDMGIVRDIVDATPCISDTRKEYLKQALNFRYEQILAPALKHVLSEQANSLAGYTIERLTEADMPAAMALVWRVFEEFEAPEYSAQGVKEFADFIASDAICEQLRQDKMALWACYVDGDMAGVLGLRWPAHICLLFVDKVYHRRGIATALLDQMRLYLAEDCREITVNSSPYAVEAYRHMGFTPTAAEQTKNGIRFIPMIWHLPSAMQINNKFFNSKF